MTGTAGVGDLLAGDGPHREPAEMFLSGLVCDSCGDVPDLGDVVRVEGELLCVPCAGSDIELYPPTPVPYS